MIGRAGAPSKQKIKQLEGPLNRPISGGDALRHQSQESAEALHWSGEKLRRCPSAGGIILKPKREKAGPVGSMTKREREAREGTGGEKSYGSQERKHRAKRGGNNPD